MFFRLQEPSTDPFNDKANGFGDNSSFGNDAFKPSNFRTAFDDNASAAPGFDNGFDDSFGNSGFAARNDPFAGSETTTSDPFGDRKNVSNAITPDVSR